MEILKLTSTKTSPAELSNFIESARFVWAALHYSSPEYELRNFFDSVIVATKDYGAEAIMHLKENQLVNIYEFLYFLDSLSSEDLHIRVKSDNRPDIEVSAFFQEEDYNTIMLHYSAFKTAIAEWKNGANAIQAFTKALG